MEVHVPFALPLLQSLKVIVQDLVVVCTDDQSVEDGGIGKEASRKHHPVGEVIDVHQENMGLTLIPVAHLTSLIPVAHLTSLIPVAHLISLIPVAHLTSRE